MTDQEFSTLVNAFVQEYRNKTLLLAFPVRNDGGPGSGNFGHKGVEGQLGGSAPSQGGQSSYKAPVTTVEKMALESNDNATSFLMNNGMGWKEALELHESGKALDKAKEIIEERHRGYEERYKRSPDGQKKLMRMSPETADKFVKECREKKCDESLNGGSTTQHVVSELNLNDKPTVLGREAFEKEAAESPSGVMYRGVYSSGNLSAEDICRITIESDKQYVGDGFHGDGTYFSTFKGTATHYTTSPGQESAGLMTACLSKNARIISSRELGRAYSDFPISDTSSRALYMGYNVIAHEANRFSDGTVEMYYITLDRSAICFLDDREDEADSKINVVDGKALADVWNAFITLSSEENRNDDESSDWITINGTHVKINEEGVAESGGKLKGMSFSKAKSIKSSKKESGSKGSGSSSSHSAKNEAWRSKVSEDREAARSMKNNKLALKLYDEGVLDYDIAVEQMRSGEIRATAEHYYDVLEANGDPTPEKETVAEQRSLHGLVGREYGGDWTEARIGEIQKDTGMSREDSERAQKEIQTWMSSSWGRADTSTLDEYIEKAPAFDGQIHRGLCFTDDEGQYDAFMDVVRGGVIRMNGNSSWSSDQSVARRFAHTEWDDTDSVMITCISNKTATPIEHLANSNGGEDEVLAHSRTSWSVVRVTETEKRDGGRHAHIIVIERGEYDNEQ